MYGEAYNITNRCSIRRKMKGKFKKVITRGRPGNGRKHGRRKNA